MYKISNTSILSLTPSNKITALGATTFCAGGNVILSATDSTRYSYQWTLNNINIPGATASKYTATTAGQYRVVVTDIPLGCSKVSSPVVVRINCKFEDPLNGNFDLQLAPNPASDITNIQFNLQKTGSVLVELVDLTGRLVETIYDGKATEGINNLDFPVDQFASGIYLVKVISDEQQQVSRLQISHP